MPDKTLKGTFDSFFRDLGEIAGETVKRKNPAQSPFTQAAEVMELIAALEWHADATMAEALDRYRQRPRVNPVPTDGPMTPMTEPPSDGSIYSATSKADEMKEPKSSADPSAIKDAAKKK